MAGSSARSLWNSMNAAGRVYLVEAAAAGGRTAGCAARLPANHRQARTPGGVPTGSLPCVQANAPVVANVSSNATSWALTGPAAPVPGVALGDMLANLSLGRAVVNIYTANFPQPLQPMGCCNNAEARSPATLKF